MLVVTVLFVLFLHTNPTGREFFDRARTLIAVNLLTRNLLCDDLPKEEEVDVQTCLAGEWFAMSYATNDIRTWVCVHSLSPDCVELIESEPCYLTVPD